MAGQRGHRAGDLDGDGDDGGRQVEEGEAAGGSP